MIDTTLIRVLPSETQILRTIQWLNDVFKFYARCETPPLSSTMRVYNRWGKIVFESNEPTSAWTATDAPSDVYYYQIIFTEEIRGEPKIRQLQEEVLLLR